MKAPLGQQLWSNDKLLVMFTIFAGLPGVFVPRPYNPELT